MIKVGKTADFSTFYKICYNGNNFIKENLFPMKFEKKQVYYIVLAFVICYAIKAYWDTGTSLVATVIKASQPFLIGAGIAYIVNIVMSLYEMIFTRLIKNKYFLKVKRAVSMILAYLTFIFLISWLFSIVLPDLIASINSLLKIDTSGIAKLYQRS